MFSRSSNVRSIMTGKGFRLASQMPIAYSASGNGQVAEVALISADCVAGILARLAGIPAGECERLSVLPANDLRRQGHTSPKHLASGPMPMVAASERTGSTEHTLGKGISLVQSVERVTDVIDISTSTAYTHTTVKALVCSDIADELALRYAPKYYTDGVGQ